tara:strand:+ start:554 stop:1351 length:798 start_codon:yes stop_codon:yes gene_type:complete
MFLSDYEKKISKEFLNNGYIVKKSKNLKALHKIRELLIIQLKKDLKIKNKVNNENLLNNIHKYINLKDLNKIRLNLIDKVSSTTKFKKLYYDASKEYIDILLGNELVMQKSLGLSIQLPKDDSSILPIHSDVWSGVSPFDIVVWIPLVDCYKTKTMFILPPKQNQMFLKDFGKMNKLNSKQIFNKVKSQLKWINIKFGEIMIFNQHLPHGNTVNIEKETRWSLNCRFKNIFSPYTDKKVGEFFEPITLRACSKLALKYNLPKLEK